MNAAYKTGHQMGNLPKPVIAAMLSVIPLTGIGLGALAVYTGYVGIADGYPAVFSLYAAGMVLCVAVFVFALGWCLAASGMARFRFEAEGLVVKYPLEKEKRIPWHQFQQVCVCYAAYTTRGQKKANTVICCVKQGEKKNLYGRWKTDNPFHHRSVICMDYSPEYHAGITRMCPYAVEDLRNTWAYRLD